MLIRKIARASALAATVALGLVASAASAQSQSVKNEAKYAPIQSVRYDFGSKSMSGYFVDQAKKCVVMLMVSEKDDPDAASSSTAKCTPKGCDGRFATGCLKPAQDCCGGACFVASFHFVVEVTHAITLSAMRGPRYWRQMHAQSARVQSQTEPSWREGSDIQFLSRE